MKSRWLGRPLTAALCLVCLAALAGCMAGPNYHRPDTPTPAAWKTEPPWRPSEPSDQIPKGSWWSIFGSDELNGLEAQAMASNQDIAGAYARLEQARAAARLTASALYPQLNLQPGIARERLAANRPGATAPVDVTENVYQIPFTVNWEPDLFGRVRRQLQAANASYQAAGADLANVQLSITAELAADYFNARQYDSEIGVLDRTVTALEQGLQLVESRERGGVASGLDVAQELTLLDTTRTQAILLRQQRAQFEDAIAVLIGKPASQFSLPAAEISNTPPAVPLGVPSDLLERRPDVAESERQMAAASAQIGVAKAAYYPSFPISVGAGQISTGIESIVNSASSTWSVGVSAVEEVLTGGARGAQMQYAQAGYQNTIAGYRGTVLNAFREVEDNLASLSVLAEAQRTQADAVTDARRALEIATNRYTGGLVSYLDVITAQQTLLENEQLAAEISGERLVSSVLLIKALGGGWDAASIAALKVKPAIKQAFAP
jgi:outer membrane protein, multidrug efflux system